MEPNLFATQIDDEKAGPQRGHFCFYQVSIGAESLSPSAAETPRRYFVCLQRPEELEIWVQN